MSEITSRRRRRRADAQRSVAAILDAAIRVLSERPEATMEEVAKAAGVTRQTVYAHYPSREALLGAVIDRATEETVAAMDAAAIDDGPPAAALLRVLDAGWQTPERYPFLHHLPMSVEESHDRHQPIYDRLERLIRRGQDVGDFDPELSPTWLLTAVISLAHAAAVEAAAGRMSSDQAIDALRRSVLRVLGGG